MHCLRSMPKVSNKLSLKGKHMVNFVIRNWCRETFFDATFYIFDKWRRVQKKYLTNIDEKILMLCRDEALKPPD